MTPGAEAEREWSWADERLAQALRETAEGWREQLQEPEVRVGDVVDWVHYVRDEDACLYDAGASGLTVCAIDTEGVALLRGPEGGTFEVHVDHLSRATEPGPDPTAAARGLVDVGTHPPSPASLAGGRIASPARPAGRTCLPTTQHHEAGMGL